MTQALTLTQGLFGCLTDQDVYRPSANASTTHRALLSEGYGSPKPIQCVVSGTDLPFPFTGDAPAWLEPTTRALAELLWLPENWDSYGALRIEQEHIEAALETLLAIMQPDTPAPSVVPTNRGSVQLEWHERGIDLEVEMLSQNRILVSFEDLVSRKEWEKEFAAEDLSVLARCVARLS